jgi:TPR repeat protein
MLGVLLGACTPPPLSVAPIASAPSTCPIDGCVSLARDAPNDAKRTLSCGKADAAACDGRSPRECAEVALAMWARAQDARTLDCLLQMFAEACEKADAPACNFAGRLVLEGHGVPRDAKRGLELLERSCDGGFTIACAVGAAWLAEASHATEIEFASEARARFEVKHACLLGQADDCYELGLSYYVGRESFPQDRVRAAQAYERACNLGDTRACNNLGDALAYGEGMGRDVTRAAELFKKACHSGEALACANLGYMVEHGEGIDRDARRARDLYRDACSTGEVYGCLHSAMLAAVTAGAPSDPARSLAHWQRGCDQGRNAQSCAFVGLLYEDGPDGKARDEAKSTEAMSRACKLGERLACEWLKAHVEE